MRNGMSAKARAEVLPEAAPVGSLSARGLNHSRGRDGEGGRRERIRTKAKAPTCLKIVGFNPMRDRSFHDARQAH